MSTTARFVLVPAALVLTLALGACGPESEITDADAPSQSTGQAGADPAPATATESRVQDLPAATEAPDSTERGVTGRASVEVPEGWTERRFDDAFSLRYLEGEGARDPMLAIAGDYGSFYGARAAASTLIAQIQVGTPGFTIHSQEDIEVEGASSAVRVDFSFGTEEEQDGVFDAMWVVAVDSGTGDTIAVAYSGGDDRVEDEDLDAVAESVRMLPAS
ncbi:hypothetical protein [Ornithinimicrobium pekingense]|uniref:Sensor domain-containing protein n=1 Tax=Ornithinimicrobium pekingense TaxID=384677 RepID=A0ABQ2FEP3_9MICO|nr:hypothetical protein [Ornithinimicrobium pekingense]GGK80400.1 hypothetical protein GCM10011509_31130 [Ornithinimicrobium pekingense]